MRWTIKTGIHISSHQVVWDEHNIVQTSMITKNCPTDIELNFENFWQTIYFVQDGFASKYNFVSNIAIVMSNLKKLLILYFYPMVWSLLSHWYLKLMYPIFYNICFCCLSICFSLRLDWQQEQEINFCFLSSSCLATGRHIFRIIALVSYWVVQLQCKSVILKKNQQRNSDRSWVIIP